MKNKLKKAIGDKWNFIIYPIVDKLPDKMVIGFMYRLSTGRRVNFKNPKYFTEKIQIYKIMYRNNLMTVCSDKFRMREYISSLGYSRMLPELYQVMNNIDEIDISALPSSFVIKLNNGSGTNLIVRDKSQMEIENIIGVVSKWKYVNTLTLGREWAYQNIERKIIVEEFLEAHDRYQRENGLNDYKLMCFNGEPQIVWVDTERESNHKRTFYDLDWNEINVKSDRNRNSSSVEKPKELAEMLDISRKIAKEFSFVRVDFYLLNGLVYIGEITFYPWSGYVKFEP